MENENKRLGLRIKQLRIEKGLSQDELAKLVGYTSRSSINKIELGKNDIPRSKLVLFADIFNVSISYLLLGVEGINEQYLTPEYQQNRADEVKSLEEKSLKECKDTLKGIFGKDVVTLIDLFLQLNEQGKAKALDSLEDLSAIDKYVE